MSRRILYITTVWPEPRSSAAGLRNLCILRPLRASGWNVVVASPSQENEARKELETEGFKTQPIQANDPMFDVWVKEFAPEVVIFERFVMEEQFSWRVKAACPEAYLVLDTIDLHSVRWQRQEWIEGGGDWTQVPGLERDLPVTPDLLRELTSILRCDHTWLVSHFEKNILEKQFGLRGRVSVSAFWYSEKNPWTTDRPRKGMTMIGNFRHPPNLQATRWLKKELWPDIRARLGKDAQVTLYGSYPPKEVMDFNDPKNGFFVAGPARDQYEALAKHEVSLAPLQYGAGIKGKVLDSLWVGTPVVTTPIGAEGLTEEDPVPALVAQNTRDWIDAVVRLARDPDLQIELRQKGFEWMRKHFSYEREAPALVQELEVGLAKNSERRKADWLNQLLWQNQFRATEFLSRWIELKNRKNHSDHKDSG